MTDLFASSIQNSEIKSLEQIACEAIEQKDYTVLEKTSKANKYNKFICLDKAIKHLDLLAVETIFQHTTFDSYNANNESLAYENLLDNLSSEFLNVCDLSSHEKFRKIVFYIYEQRLLRNIHITSKDIQKLYMELPIQYLKLLINKHFSHSDILTLNEREQDLGKIIGLMDHEVDFNTNSIFSTYTCSSNEFGPILHHTYSALLEIEYIYNIYKVIYNSGKIGRAIISYLNTKILHQDKIDILFHTHNYSASKNVSSFVVSGNYIQINFNDPSSKLVIEATTAHEIAHYIVANIFHYYSTPFDVCSDDNKIYEENLTKFYRQFKFGPWDISKSVHENLCSNSQNECFSLEVKRSIEVYYDAIKDILLKAINILGLTEQIQSNDLGYLKEYLSNNSVIASLYYTGHMVNVNNLGKAEILSDIVNNSEFQQELEDDIKIIKLINALMYHVKMKVGIDRDLKEFRHIIYDEESYNNYCFDDKVVEFINSSDNPINSVLLDHHDILAMRKKYNAYKEYLLDDLTHFLLGEYQNLNLLFQELEINKYHGKETLFFQRYIITFIKLGWSFESLIFLLLFSNTMEDSDVVAMKPALINWLISYTIRMKGNELSMLEESCGKKFVTIINEIKLASDQNNTKILDQPSKELVLVGTETKSIIYQKDMLNSVTDLLFVKNYFFNKMVKKLDLTSGETYFLARVGDLVNRSFEQFEEEGVVRCVEMEVQSKFMDIPQDIMDSCNKMNQFWEDYIFPRMGLQYDCSYLEVDYVHAPEF